MSKQCKQYERFPVSECEIKDFHQKCKNARLSITRQRCLVWSVLASLRCHPTADMVYALAKERLASLSRMSVFRILDTLSVCKIIRRIEHPLSSARYDADASNHCHIICKHCGETVDWPNHASLNVVMPTKENCGFEIEDYSVSFYGLCQVCQNERMVKAEKGQKTRRMRAHTPAKVLRGTP